MGDETEKLGILLKVLKELQPDVNDYFPTNFSISVPATAITAERGGKYFSDLKVYIIYLIGRLRYGRRKAASGFDQFGFHRQPEPVCRFPNIFSTGVAVFVCLLTCRCSRVPYVEISVDCP